MECIFLNTAGTTLFVRDDMENGHWVQQEMNLTADFPFDSGKVIEFGMRVAFRDPATDVIEVFEVVNVRNQEPAHYQQITAEHICIAELSDEHLNSTEITNKTASEALTTALTGTLWSVGNNTASGSQSANLSRGSVWDAVNAIQKNWNVYITPRVTISSAGAITGRYLDIAPATGTWRGLRLSIRKNMTDPVVTYDDSEVYTALYGYGGNVDVPQTSGDDTQEELTFKDVVWTATSGHPAKPANQTYLEWPEKTALYGRNGRPRYGYYQNSSIKDANILLQKTWESLQQSCNPKISISGTCSDLYRLGYKDQPIRLHDQVVVEIEETGEQFYKQIICNDVDLIDPTNTKPEIGDYIENIIYINRDTNKRATGGGGGRGRGSMTGQEDNTIKFQSEFIRNDQLIGLVVGLHDGTGYIKAASIVASINDDGGTNIKLEADTIDIDGIVNELIAYDVTVATITTTNTAVFGGEVTCNEGLDMNGSDFTGATNLDAEYATFTDITATGDTTVVNLDASGDVNISGNTSVVGLSATGDSTLKKVTATRIEVPDAYLKVGSNWAQWKSFNYYTYGTYESYFLYGDSSYNPTGRHYGGLITSSTQHTINYLGKWTA